MFFCDPPGKSDPESLFNFGNDITESNYIFLHDQEPIHLDIHKSLFDNVYRRNGDLNNTYGPRHSAIVTSEYNSEFVDQVCMQYGWKPYYYFFHGWAALDWYRGYNRTWLMPDPEYRKIKKSFISPNRIVGGYRDHRVLLLYHIFKSNIDNAWISCPDICPFENLPITTIASKFKKQYNDIVDVFQTAPVPLHFPGETDHPMHSCWLSLFDQCAETLAYVVTETTFFGQRNHLTEKTFKPICQQMPFILVSNFGSLEYLQRYGFKTFNHIWNEDYDSEPNDLLRLEKIAQILKKLDSASPSELNQMYRDALPVIKHNYQHFYGGGFEQILWAEMRHTLSDISDDFRV